MMNVYGENHKNLEILTWYFTQIGESLLSGECGANIKTLRDARGTSAYNAYFVRAESTV
jgi:hypothetical protein